MSEPGRDKVREAFNTSLVTLFQCVIHVDKCIKQSLRSSAFSSAPRGNEPLQNWTPAEFYMWLWVQSCRVGIAGTDVVLTSEMSH